MNEMIWDFWASRYHRLWVQKHSLRPTRHAVLDIIRELEPIQGTRILDLGCGVGELMEELEKNHGGISLTGIDSSGEMLRISKSRNPNAKHIQLAAEELSSLKDSFDIIVCTHSFPYYAEKHKVIMELHRLLAPGGSLVIAFASINSLYDKLVMSMVKLTTGSAEYPSHDSFLELINPCFDLESHQIIRERPYMPTISVYQLRRKEL